MKRNKNYNWAVVVLYGFETNGAISSYLFCTRMEARHFAAETKRIFGAHILHVVIKRFNYNQVDFVRLPKINNSNK